MKPQAAVFDKSQPATKLHIWNTFRRSRGFRSVQIDQAHETMGINAPRYWIRKGWLTRHENRAGELVYTLTPEGRDHLRTGVSAFLKNHPDLISEFKALPRDMQ